MTNKQRDFCENKSTNTATVAFNEDLVRFVEADECPIGIFCDLNRASDCVNHDRLLFKLKHYGLSGTPLAWLQSFLTNRMQYVVVNHVTRKHRHHVYSDKISINTGVPQGSILGPVLYICILMTWKMLLTQK